MNLSYRRSAWRVVPDGRISMRVLVPLALIVWALAAIGVVPSVEAQVAERWFPADGPNGGTIVTLATDPYNNVLAGTLGGIYQLRTGQARWERLDSLNVRVSAIAAMGDTIIASANVLVSSRDGGLTWQGFPGHSPVAVLLDRAGDAFFAQVGTFSIRRSTDAGLSWMPIAGPTPGGSEVKALYQGPGDEIYVATTTKVYRFKKSTVTWNASVQTFRELATIAARDEYVVAGSRDGVHISTDAGVTWAETPITNIAIRQVAVGPSGVTYAASSEGIFMSRDSGRSWSQSTLMSTAVVSLTVDSAGVVYAGTTEADAEAVYRSSDQGATWTLFINGLTSPRVWTMAGDAQDLFAATIRSGVHRSSDDGRSWRRVSGLFLVSLAAHPSGDLWSVIRDTVLRSTDRGSTWQRHTPMPQLFFPLRRIAIAPNGSIFLVTRGNLHRSTDNGATWSSISLAFGAYSDINNEVLITIDREGTIFAAIDFRAGSPGSVFVHRSTDNGATWTKLENSPSKVRMIFANDQEHVLTVSALGISRSTDYGDSWRTVNIGVPTDAYVQSLAADAAGAFYAATDKGVIRLPKGAAIWEKMPSAGLPGNAASLVYVSPNQSLFAGALEAGLYLYEQRASDATVERQTDRETAQLSARQIASDGMMVGLVLAKSSYGTISVHDVLGNRIQVLREGEFSAGDARLEWGTHGLPRGTYLLVFRGNGIQRTIRVILR
jgi:photosystem II stability/assembly factor-like uncharacterized protein